MDFNFGRDRRLNVASLNCFLLPKNPLQDVIPGLPAVQDPDQTTARVNDICHNVTSGEYDIVCFQEVFTETYRQQMHSNLAEEYPHSVTFTSGIVGSGHMVFSKHPVLSSYLQAFLHNDRVFPLGSADSLGGKGCTVVLLKIADLMVTVINNHSQSELTKDSKDEIRLLHLFELARLVRCLKLLSDVVIVCGDLNATKDFLGIRLLKLWAGLSIANEFPEESGLATTYARPDNCLVEAEYQAVFPEGVAIDYIMYVSGSRDGSISRSQSLYISCENFCVRPWGLTGGSSLLPFSDHEAIQASFKCSNLKCDGDSEESSGVSKERSVVEEAVVTFQAYYNSFCRKLNRSIFLIKICAFIILIAFLLFSLLLGAFIFYQCNCAQALIILFIFVIAAIFGALFNTYLFYYETCSLNAFNQAIASLQKS